MPGIIFSSIGPCPVTLCRPAMTYRAANTVCATQSAVFMRLFLLLNESPSSD